MASPEAQACGRSTTLHVAPSQPPLGQTFLPMDTPHTLLSLRLTYLHPFNGWDQGSMLTAWAGL